MGSTSYEASSGIKVSYYYQKWPWLAFFASFAAKIPMLPVYMYVRMYVYLLNCT